MSEYAHIVERARKAFSSVSSMEALIAKEPDNYAAHSNIIGLRRRALAAKGDVETFASSQHIDVCYYRLVPEAMGSYGVGDVSSCLLSYQNLFSQVHDAIRNGPKQKATIGREAKEESTLDIAYTYSGSLGIALLVRSERGFFDGSLDKPIDVMYQIMDIDDVDRVKDIAQILGRAVVKRVHDWSKASVEGGFSADIKWKRSDGKFLGQMIEKVRLQHIVNFIESSSDTKTHNLEVTAMLVGGDLQSKTFHLTVPGGESYKGIISDEASLVSQKLGNTYHANIEVSETYFFATDQTKIVNKLISLIPVSPQLTFA
jgi:hypothetical protein